MQAKMPRSEQRFIAVLIFVAGLIISVALIFLFLITRALGDVQPQVTQTTNRQRKVSLPSEAKVSEKVIPAVRPTDITYGNVAAPVVIFEYGDLECPFCKQLHPVLQDALAAYGSDLGLVYRQFPLTSHPNAPMEAQVLVCAARQGNEFAQKLITETYARSVANGASFSEAEYLDLVGAVGGSRSKAESCYKKGESAEQVSSDKVEGKELGVFATPTFFLVSKNTTLIVQGSVSLDILKDAIDYLRSGSPELDKA